MKRSKVRGLSALLIPGAIVVMATACSTSDPGPDGGTGGMTGATGGATGSGGMTGASGGATGSGGATAGVGGGTSSGGGFQAAGGTVAYCDDHGTDLEAPFPVELPEGVEGDGFIASGYMEGAVEHVTRIACPDRAPGEFGACSGWTFDAASPAWGGVAWIYPWNAWTSTEVQPGLCVSDDVTAVTFYAKGAEGGEVISFGAAADGQSTGDVTLEATWTKYTIPITVFNNHAGGGTQNAFSWVSAKPTETITFYVDSIQWITAEGGLGGAGPM